MKSNAKTVDQYLDELPPDRRDAIRAVRKVVLDNLPKGCEEVMSCGMIGYVVPHSIYPAGYHCNPKQPLPLANLASQKNYMSVHLMTLYGKNEAWFREEFKKTGKKLDMGKCCVRFKRLDDLPLDLIGRAIAKVPVAEYVAVIERFTRDRKPVPRAEIRARAEAKAAAKRAKAAVPARGKSR